MALIRARKCIVGTASEFPEEAIEGQFGYDQDTHAEYWHDGAGWVPVVSGGGGPHKTSHQNGGSDEISVAGLSGLLADPQTPLAHSHAQSDVTGLVTALSGKETANANIQAHVTAAHAPSDAQKNADITKPEIEAKLTGEISSHTHAGGAAGDVAMSKMAPTGNTTVPPGYAAYIPHSFQVVSGVALEIGLGAVFEIG